MVKLSKQQIKIVLSPLYFLPESEDVIDFNDKSEHEEEEIQQIKNKELFFLKTKGESYYLINPTIRSFLLAFKEPRTLQEVTLEFAEKSSCEVEQIEAIMLQFFKQMQSQGIIINPDLAQNLNDILTKEPIEIAKYAIGDKIGNYQVTKSLVVKNASQLYLGQHPDQQEEVVIKTVIFPSQLPDKIKNRSIKKFRQEFFFMQKLEQHPNVCKLVEYHENDAIIFAAIEYIKGESIRSFAKNDTATIKDKINVIHQVLAAIAHVQKHGILHGDIHLSNFIVQENGQVKLIDFGMSNQELPKDNEILRNGAVHSFVPPERIKISAFGFLKKRADYCSEVFQIGVLIYFLFYEKHPFSGFTWQKLATDISEKILEYSDTTPNQEKIPKVYLAVLEKALQKNPADRFSNAKEMVDFLTCQKNQQDAQL